jgi:hypothetical protein
MLTDIPADIDVTSHIRPQSNRADLGCICLTQTSETSERKTDKETRSQKHSFVGSEEEQENDWNTNGVVDHERFSVSVSIIEPCSPVYTKDSPNGGSLGDSRLESVVS